MSKHIGKYERELLHDRKSGRGAENTQLFAQGLRVCRNVNCASAGSPMQLELFLKLKRGPEGYDYYCFECRRWARARSEDKDYDRKARWDATRNANKRARRVARAASGVTVAKQHKNAVCKLHPHMLAQDCYIGECATRKRSNKRIELTKQQREKIAASMRGKCNNPTGKTRKVKRIFTYEQRQNMSAAAQRRWAAGR